MAAADVLKKYLHFEEMEEDSFKMKLSNILDRIDDENADYVTRMLKTDIDAFIAEKISPEWRNIITVLLCVRRQYAVTYLDGIFDDFNSFFYLNSDSLTLNLYFVEMAVSKGEN